MANVQDMIIILNLNGQRVLLHTELGRKDYDLKVPNTRFYVPNNINLGDLVKAIGFKEEEYDFAKPYDWVQEYRNKHDGSYPTGIWWYGEKENSVSGRFVGLNEILERLGRAIINWEVENAADLVEPNGYRPLPNWRASIGREGEKWFVAWEGQTFYGESKVWAVTQLSSLIRQKELVEAER